MKFMKSGFLSTKRKADGRTLNLLRFRGTFARYKRMLYFNRLVSLAQRAFAPQVTIWRHGANLKGFSSLYFRRRARKVFDFYFSLN